MNIRVNLGSVIHTLIPATRYAIERLCRTTRADDCCCLNRLHVATIWRWLPQQWPTFCHTYCSAKHNESAHNRSRAFAQSEYIIHSPSVVSSIRRRTATAETFSYFPTTFDSTRCPQLPFSASAVHWIVGTQRGRSKCMRCVYDAKCATPHSIVFVCQAASQPGRCNVVHSHNTR